MGYLDFLQNYGPQFLDGAAITLAQTGMATVLALVIALTVGMFLRAPNIFVQRAATVYVEFFRGTSLLVQLYVIFFVLPLFGFTLDKFVAGFLAVGLNLGAYGAEVVRGAILSVPKGQWEAAVALNMSSRTQMVRVILPQAFLLMLPALGNLLIELLKGTALVALISVADLMFVSKQINGSTYLSVQAFGTALGFYYVIARFVITPTMRYLERIMARRVGRA